MAMAINLLHSANSTKETMHKLQFIQRWLHSITVSTLAFKWIDHWIKSSWQQFFLIKFNGEKLNYTMRAELKHWDHWIWKIVLSVNRGVMSRRLKLICIQCALTLLMSEKRECSVNSANRVLQWWNYTEFFPFTMCKQVLVVKQV